MRYMCALLTCDARRRWRGESAKIGTRIKREGGMRKSWKDWWMRVERQREWNKCNLSTDQFSWATFLAPPSIQCECADWTYTYCTCTQSCTAKLIQMWHTIANVAFTFIISFSAPHENMWQWQNNHHSKEVLIAKVAGGKTRVWENPQISTVN